MADHRVKTILDLPVEVLAMILAQVDLKDKVNLSKVCQTFEYASRLCVVNRHWNLRKAYGVDMSDVNSYASECGRSMQVISLDLTGCYWIESSILSRFARNLKHLQILHAIDTRFRASDIRDILFALPMLTTIAFSWPGGIELSGSFPNIKSVYIYSANETCLLEAVLVFLTLFPNLEKLCVLDSLIRSDPFAPLSQCGIVVPVLRIRRNNFTKLNSVVLHFNSNQSDAVKDFYECIVGVSYSATVWEKFWSTVRTDTGTVLPRAKVTFIGSPIKNEDLSFLERAYLMPNEHFRLHSYDFVQCLRNVRSLAIPLVLPLGDLRNLNHLEELNLIPHSVSYDHWQDVQLGQRLLKLGLPLSVLEESDAKPSSASSSSSLFRLFRRNRTSHLNTGMTTSVFKTIVESCPNVKEFEIGVFEDSRTRPKRDARYDVSSLTNIGKWSNLKRLTIGKVPVTSLTFLQEIARGCPRIEALSLLRLRATADAYTMHQLGQILPLFTRLEDLVIRQPESPCGKGVLRTLCQCTLRRVTLQCSDATGYREFRDFLTKCDKVVFLLFQSNHTVEEMARLEMRLGQCFLQRQDLVIRILNHNLTYRISALRTLPAVHESEMFYQGSRIAVFPHSGSRYLDYD